MVGSVNIRKYCLILDSQSIKDAADFVSKTKDTIDCAILDTLNHVACALTLQFSDTTALLGGVAVACHALADVAKLVDGILPVMDGVVGSIVSKVIRQALHLVDASCPGIA